MTDLRRIIEDRLNRWTDKLCAENATPVALLGIGHEHNGGKLIVCTLEDAGDGLLSELAIAKILRAAADQMEAKDSALKPRPLWK